MTEQTQCPHCGNIPMVWINYARTESAWIVLSKYSDPFSAVEVLLRAIGGDVDAFYVCGNCGEAVS